MTSSDLTVLPPDAKERAATRVGTALDGDTARGATPASSGPRIGLACAEFNGGITYRLLSGALNALEESGCDLATTIVAWVPGAFELPVVAQELARSGAVDAVICLGAVIRGDTGHYEFVAGECASGLQRVQLDTGMPVVFGVLTTETIEQALVRSADDESNKGREAARTAIDTVGVLRSVSAVSSGRRVGFAVGKR
jgi:6,7-dimethyl-8-ribityllumazine synthase